MYIIIADDISYMISKFYWGRVRAAWRTWHSLDRRAHTAAIHAACHSRSEPDVRRRRARVPAVYLSIYLSIYLSLSLYIYIYIYIHICVYTYISLSLYIYIYIYIHSVLVRGATLYGPGNATAAQRAHGSSHRDAGNVNIVLAKLE